MPDPGRLRELFAEPGLRWVMERLEQRLRRGQPLAGSLSLRDPGDEQRQAMERLLGRAPGRSQSLSLRLDRLETRLRHAGLADDLEQAMKLLVGDVDDRRARRRADRQRLRSLLDGAAERDPRLAIARWLASRRTWILLRRWGGQEGAARQLLDQALAVLDRLPADRRLLQEIAVDVTGDAHALDSGRRLGTLVIPAVQALGHSRGDEPADWHDAAGWRDLWSAVGVVADDLSAPVLVFGLRGNVESYLGRLLELHRQAGEPCRLSLRQLRRHADELGRLLAASPPETVYVCENPAVVLAAAVRLGVPASPLVCLEGQPATAARQLLDALREAGVPLRYHGDFDWTGLRIANLVIERHAAKPWRYGTEDYLRACEQGRSGPPLLGEPVAASWDLRLKPAMAERGEAVHEEAMLDELIGDLA